MRVPARTEMTPIKCSVGWFGDGQECIARRAFAIFALASAPSQFVKCQRDEVNEAHLFASQCSHVRCEQPGRASVKWKCAQDVCLLTSSIPYSSGLLCRELSVTLGRCNRRLFILLALRSYKQNINVSCIIYSDDALLRSWSRLRRFLWRQNLERLRVATDVTSRFRTSQTPERQRIFEELRRV